MKKILLLLFVLFLYSDTFSQYFDITYSTQESSQTFDIKTDKFGNFIVLGRYIEASTSKKKPFIYKINSDGELVDSVRFFQSVNNDFKVGSINIFDNYYIFVVFRGQEDHSGTGPNNKSLVFIKTNTSLDIIDSTSYNFLDGNLPFFYRTKVDNDFNLITVGSYDLISAHRGAFIIKMSLGGVLLNNSIFPPDNDGLHIFSDFLVDTNYYYVFTNNYQTIRLLSFDYNLNIVDTNRVSNMVWAEDASYGILDGDNYYATTNQSSNPAAVYTIAKSSIEGNVSDSLMFGVADSCNHNAFMKPFCKVGGYLYYFGVPYKDCYWPNYYPSKLHLIKMDTNMNIIWQKFYHGNEFIFPTSIIQTNDGGLLLMSSLSTTPNFPMNLNVHLMKIDIDGNTVDISTNMHNELAYSVYPNPAKDKLNISLLSENSNIAELRIYDVQGRQVLQKTINAKESEIDVSSFSDGLYIIKVTSNTGYEFFRKFVKQ